MAVGELMSSFTMETNSFCVVLAD